MGMSLSYLGTGNYSVSTVDYGNLICMDPTNYDGSSIFNPDDTETNLTCDDYVASYLSNGYEFNTSFCNETEVPNWNETFRYTLAMLALQCCPDTYASICASDYSTICYTPSQFQGSNMVTSYYVDCYAWSEFTALSGDIDCTDSATIQNMLTYASGCCTDSKSACWVNQSEFCLDAGMYNSSAITEPLFLDPAGCDLWVARILLQENDIYDFATGTFQSLFFTNISSLNCSQSGIFTMGMIADGKDCCQDLKTKCFVDRSEFCYDTTAFQPFAMVPASEGTSEEECTTAVKYSYQMECEPADSLELMDMAQKQSICCADKKMRCWQDFSPICQNPSTYVRQETQLMSAVQWSLYLVIDPSAGGSPDLSQINYDENWSSPPPEVETCDSMSMLFAAMFNITNFSKPLCNMDDPNLVKVATLLGSLCCTDKIAACKMDYSAICPVNTTYNPTELPYNAARDKLLYEKFCPTCEQDDMSFYTCDLMYAMSNVDPTQECGGFTDLDDLVNYASVMASCCTNDNASVTTPPMSPCALNETLPAQLCLVASNYNKHAMIDLGSNQSINCHSGFYAWFGTLSQAETVFQPRHCDFNRTRGAIDVFAASCCGAGGISVCHPSSSPSSSHSPSSNSTGASSSPSSSFSPAMSASKSMESASKSIEKASNGSSGLIPGGMLISFLLFSLGFLFNFL
eukprot:gb/GEZN01002555.1/.p1 GENE.gb/GEZN01002555.1/~~gb/GEZN01002555.1/.p1  ORF type:complete len:687 (-),score=41.46 gb/GEZN01002555.1/:353-2413(-)